MCYGEPVSEVLAKLGREVGQRPVMILVATLLITFILADKFINKMTLETDLDILFVPQGSEGMANRHTLETYFPPSDLPKRFVEGHETKKPTPGVEVHLTPEVVGGIMAGIGTPQVSALAPHVLKAAELVDNVIRTRLVVQTTLLGDLRNNERPGETKRTVNVTWSDVCARNKGGCVNPNRFLELAPHLRAGGGGPVKLTFPFTKNPLTRQTYVVASNLGGVVVMGDSSKGSAEVKDASSIRLFYPVDPDARWAALWEQECRSLALKFRFRTNDSDMSQAVETRVTAISSTTIKDELVLDVLSGLDTLPLTSILLVAFGMCSALPGSADRPVVMAFGIINTLLATASAWGFIVWVFGTPFQVINLSGIFILLGVGMDDTFLMLSAWSKATKESGTGPKSVPRLMELCYRESGASITISSMTNFVGFMMGVAIPGFESVSNYCLFTGGGILFIYIWTLVAFGCVLAISGYLEMADILLSNKYCRIIVKAQAAIERGLELIQGQSKGRNNMEEHDETKSLSASDSRSFFDLWANVMLPKFIGKMPVKLTILALYVAYLAASAVGVSQIKEGFDRKDLAQKTSYSQAFYKEDDAHFRQNPYRLQVAIVGGRLDYSDPAVRAGADELLRMIRDSPWVDDRFGGDFEENWLAMMDEYLAEKGRLQLGRPLVASELGPAEFLKELEVASDKLGGLFRDYVKLEGEKGQEKIVASRFFLQSSGVKNVEDEMNMVRDLRQIAMDWTARFGAGFQSQAIVYNGLFPHLDQVLSLAYQTALTLTASLIMVFIVTFLLLPSGTGTGGRTYKRSLVASTVVLASVLSIEFCLCGMMYFVGVSLDVVSLNSLVMCVGFAVDYCAHMTYHILVSDSLPGAGSSDGKVMDEAIVSGVRAVGVPIAQSFLSSALSVILFTTKPSYILKSFAALMCLVVALGTVHGLFLLPVILPWSLHGRKAIAWAFTRQALSIPTPTTLSENSEPRAIRSADHQPPSLVDNNPQGPQSSQAAAAAIRKFPLGCENESYIPATDEEKRMMMMMLPPKH